jgi:hypothetical protein
MNYGGIDLNSNNSVVSVIDETDRVVAEKRLPNDLGTMSTVRLWPNPVRFGTDESFAAGGGPVRRKRPTTVPRNTRANDLA